MRKVLELALSIFQYLVLPPLVVSCGAWLIWGTQYIVPAFLLSLGVDLMVGFCVNAFTSVKLARISADLEKERMDFQRGQVIGISCAKCGERNIIPLDLQIDGFTCSKCGSKNKVYYNFHAETVFDLRREEFSREAIAEKLKEDVGSSVWDSLGN